VHFRGFGEDFWAVTQGNALDGPGFSICLRLAVAQKGTQLQKSLSTQRKETERFLEFLSLEAER
jgi:hypothetical protein